MAREAPHHRRGEAILTTSAAFRTAVGHTRAGKAIEANLNNDA
jgi:hypothetical protein